MRGRVYTIQYFQDNGTWQAPTIIYDVTSKLTNPEFIDDQLLIQNQFGAIKFSTQNIAAYNFTASSIFPTSRVDLTVQTRITSPGFKTF